MKKISVLALLIFFTNHSNLFAQQHYYTFSELKGMEDSSGSTHLFYRLYTFQKGGSIIGDYYENSIHHFDLKNETDTLFLFDGGRIGDFTTSIIDFEFWNSDPSEFIYLGVGASVDPVAYIQRFDQEQATYIQLGEAFSLELGKQNDSLVIASAPLLIKSTDGGFNWAPFTDSLGYLINSISPYGDDEMFFSSYGGSLYKTTDGGSTINLVDTARFSQPKLLYDIDSIHIYNATYNSLRVSDSRGNAFSWTERYSSSNPIYVSVDYSQSGSIYLADGRYIYHSTDYGVSFSEWKVLDRRIVGIYKKPNSDKLYAATKYDLYEITPDTILTLKHLPLDPDIFSWFPLKVGNKWIYNSRFTSESETNEHTLVIEVTGQFRYDDKTYFDINGEYGLCYRIDSTSGKIYRAYFDNDTLDYEELYIDLTAEIGDTIYVVQFGGSYPILLANEEAFNDWNLNLRKRNYLGQSTPLYDLSLVKNVGLYYQLEWELVGYEDELKGAVIDGKVYGDTTVVGVNDPDNTIKEFSLSQNYPNPFNPSTKIIFVIPKSSFVNLKVYDVLGREVAILVNEEKYPGSYEAEFNGINLSSGIYFSVLNIGDKRLSKKMCLLK